MLRAARMLAAALLCGASPAAQVFGIWLVDEKAERKFAKNLTVIDGAALIVCEPVPGGGIHYDRGRNRIEYSPETNEVFVADPADPTWVPYEIEDGERKPNGRKAVLRVAGKYVERVGVLMADQSLYGLSREYGMRRARVEAHREARDAQDEGSAAWSWAHLQMLGEYESLRTWLARTAYAEAAEELGEVLEKERKRAKGEALEARLERALASVRIVPPPARLVEVAQAITGGELELGVAESEHVRIVFDRAGVNDELAQDLLAFAERAIDGFRRSFVDPYLAPDFPDHVPDHLFLELWIGPARLDWHERFYVDYYDHRWGDNKDKRLAVRGQTNRRAEPPEFLDYGKREDHDLLGVVAHRIGHVLADLHFNANVPGMQQDWLGEAVGYHIAFEYFGRNDETCYAFQEEHRYGGPPVSEGEQGLVEILLGERYVYNQLALDRGRSIDRLAPMTIVAMGDADLAKAWSLFDHVARNEGKTGQVWLRAACRLAREKGPGFVLDWREESARLFDTSPAAVFDEIEARWRAHAEAEQRAGVPKKR